MITSTETLNILGIKPFNSGACSGPGQWASATDAGLLDSVNPATGEILAHVSSCSAKDYAVLIEKSQRAFLEWRKVPAPNEAKSFV